MHYSIVGVVMKELKTLVIFFSRSGFTHHAAELIAKEMAAEIEEIKTNSYPPGIIGYLTAAWHAISDKRIKFYTAKKEILKYDLVIVGSPLWATHTSTPVKSYLQKHRHHFKNVAFFLTHGGPSPKAAFLEMEQIAGKAPVETLSLQASDFNNGEEAKKIRIFTEKLKLNRGLYPAPTVAVPVEHNLTAPTVPERQAHQ